MAIRVALRHTTRYTFERSVSLSPHVVRLRPAPHCRTPVQAYSLNIAPECCFLNWQQDPFGNYLARLVIPEPSRELCIDVELIVSLSAINPFDFFLEESAETYPFDYEPVLRVDLAAYLQPCPVGPLFDALMKRIRHTVLGSRRRSVDVLVEINQLVQQSLRYDIRMEPGVFAPEETLVRGHGSCRDFAWLLTNVFRSLGLGARFVSGYSIQLRADQKPLEGPAGVAQDCTDLHAWSEVYLPGAGWVGFDATSGLCCGEGHIPLACTPEPTQAAPVTGSYRYTSQAADDKVDAELHFTMSVERIEDPPRPTKSFTEEQWAAILACGQEVDRALESQDVRLTMGGEPTFVSVDDMDGAEWNTLALGAAKEKIAGGLIRRLMAAFAPGGLLHHGQGKWYPGEQLPRWAYGCYFRVDGEPIWRDPDRIAADSADIACPSLALKFAQALSARLQVEEAHIQPAYEDVLYYLWREGRLAVNVDPFDSKLEDELERARLRRLFSRGLTQVVGYVLPLRPVEMPNNERAWESGAWLMRDGRLYLLPGDSAMGYRLPLDSLSWQDASQATPSAALDPFAPRPALPAHRILVQLNPGQQKPGHLDQVGDANDSSNPGQEPAGRVIRSALCIEPRNGILHVFMPPIERLEPYLQLVTQVELTAEELDIAVRMEGYPPPNDPRVQRIQLTPDPGVIEVNIHPARSWDQLVSYTTTLYEQARLARLGTDKFMLDGRHAGTGGGNHLVLGGATAQDSPFLRRPDLLRSLVSFFHNHPSLSYLFSGLFVGPTSQAPRIDEARQDSLYELEVAFQALDRHQGTMPPWLVDRVFRHLLVDVTGNTHRTEFCMDKLYSPDSIHGRQGLLELRAFEMPPDARMSLAQQLLVRALVAHCWRRPYRRSLQRWGTALHERFSLPHFLWEDLRDALFEISEDGPALDIEWFRPHLEFRFPALGTISACDVTLELRQAIEPWHVLGEEVVANGTARYVDSSLERMQVLVRGLVDSRHAITVNRCRIPLQPTGRSGEFVAGVRYKAWKPPASLHPTLEVNGPLTFDIVDTWANRAIAGCRYFVAHPGGLAHSAHPTNGLEAETRRNARFLPFGHTPGRRTYTLPSPSLELPLVLDLRSATAEPDARLESEEVTSRGQWSPSNNGWH